MVEKIHDALEEIKIDLDRVITCKEESRERAANQKDSLRNLLKRPDINLNKLLSNSVINSHKAFRELFRQDARFREEVLETVETDIKYLGYTERQKKLASNMRRWEKIEIPEDLDFSSINNLSVRSREILKQHKPKTIADAARLPNVAFADLVNLATFLEIKRLSNGNKSKSRIGS